jgi:hypothetical protein
MSDWHQGSGWVNTKEKKINTYNNLILKWQLQDRVTREHLVLHLPTLHLGQGLLTISPSSYRKWGQLYSKGQRYCEDLIRHVTCENFFWAINM